MATLSDPDKDGMREHWWRYMLGLSKEIGDAAHGVVYREGVLAELADSQVPVLAIAGEEDHAYPPSFLDTSPEPRPWGGG